MAIDLSDSLTIPLPGPTEEQLQSLRTVLTEALHRRLRDPEFPPDILELAAGFLWSGEAKH